MSSQKNPKTIKTDGANKTLKIKPVKPVKSVKPLKSVKSVKSYDITFNDAINNYYKLKNNYETPYKNLVDSLVKNKILTIEDKKKKISQYKNKCVNCNSLGGSIFKQENNILIAQCGNDDNPCRLDIRLQKGQYENIYNILNELNTNINDNKIATIKIKYDFLFGFTSESSTVSDFNKLKTALVEEVKKYQDIFSKYLEIMNNEEKKTKIYQQSKGLLSLIDSFKTLMKQFDETGEETFLKEATELYIDNIIKTANNIRKLKYATNKVEFNEKDKIYKLKQKSYNEEDLLILIPGSENKIIKYQL